jgi:hypothetical protein
LIGEVARVERFPPILHALFKAEGPNNLCVAPCLFTERQTLGATAGGRLHRSRCPTLRQKCEADEQQSARDREIAEQRMQEKHDAEIDRHPWQIEKGGRPHARKEAADLVEIADRLQPISDRPSLERKKVQGLEDLFAHLVIDAHADPAHNPDAEEVEEAVGDVEAGHEQGQADEGRDAVRGQHAVVDLQHVERAGQRQQIDQPGEDADAQKQRSASAKGLNDRIDRP